MLSFARTSFEVPPAGHIICGLTQLYGAGVPKAQAIEALANRIWDNSENYCDDWEWAQELARSALRNYNFPFMWPSEVTIFLYFTED
jgi:hypothetical protein